MARDTTREQPAHPRDSAREIARDLVRADVKPMTGPARFLVPMLLFLVAVGAVAFLLRHILIQAFFYNPVLNGLIGVVLLFGIGLNFRQVLMLSPEATWIRSFRSDRPIASTEPLRLLAPMAAMLGERKGGRLSLSAMAARSLLDGIAARLEEQRDTSRYVIGLLIFLGLLGTFWGLLETVGAVSGVIASLNTQAGDVSALFNDLQAGLKAPLSGMGTAFGTSMFGLAFSLVIGFLDLQAGQAQNRFYNELEDWLAGLTRVGGGPVGDGEQPVPAYIQALLEQTADNLENLQRTMERAEEGRGAGNAALAALADRLGQLAEQSRTEQQLMARLAEAQLDMKPALQRFVDAAQRVGGGGDETARASLRNVEALLTRLVEDTRSGRVQMTQDLRGEIRLLARTIAALAEEERTTG